MTQLNLKGVYGRVVVGACNSCIAVESIINYLDVGNSGPGGNAIALYYWHLLHPAPSARTVHALHLFQATWAARSVTEMGCPVSASVVRKMGRNPAKAIAQLSSVYGPVAAGKIAYVELQVVTRYMHTQAAFENHHVPTLQRLRSHSMKLGNDL